MIVIFRMMCIVVFQVASWGLMLAASNEDMKAYWCNEVFAKVYSLYCGLHAVWWIIFQYFFCS